MTIKYPARYRPAGVLRRDLKLEVTAGNRPPGPCECEECPECPECPPACETDIGGLAWITDTEPLQDGTWHPVAAPIVQTDGYDGYIALLFQNLSTPNPVPGLYLMNAAGTGIATLCDDCVVYTSTWAADQTWYTNHGNTMFATIGDVPAPLKRHITCGPSLQLPVQGSPYDDGAMWPGVLTVTAHLASDPDTVYTVGDITFEDWYQL